MCRHAAYIGPGIALSAIMRDVSHSLYQQSFAARELLTGTVCADGYGMAWYDADVRPEPARYASILPIWNDVNLQGFGPLVHAPVIVGAVRNATVEGSIDATNCAPFAHGRWSWSLNGFLDDFDASWRAVAASVWVDEAEQASIRGRTDGEWLFAAFRSRLAQGQDPASALQGLCRRVVAHGRDIGQRVYLNLLASDGARLYATRAGTEQRQNSLYHLHDGREFPGAHVIASEPLYDDPGWQPVDPDTVLVVQEGAPPVRLRI